MTNKIQPQEQNQSQAQTSKQAIFTGQDWYAESTGAERIELINQALTARGWVNGIKDDLTAKLEVFGFRYLEVFINGKLLCDVDMRGFNAANIDLFLDTLEERINFNKGLFANMNITKPRLNFYDVALSRDTAEEITIRVKARNAEEAKDQARDKAENDLDLTWNPTDYVGDVQINQVDIVFPSRRNGDEEKPAERVFSASDERQTNVDVVTDIMEYSSYGALAQAFVMDALVKFSKIVMDTPSEKLAMMDNGIITCEAWKGVAAEINQKLARYHGN